MGAFLRKKRVFIMIFLVLTLITIAVTIGSSRWVRVDEHMVHFDDLPAHLHGLRILHIADLHSNHTERMNVNIWRHVDQLEFDIAVITGDIVTDAFWPNAGPMHYLDPHKPYLSALAQRVPTFFVEGNHEARTTHLFAQIMRDLGITFLHNDTYMLEIGDGHLEIAGTIDHSSMRRRVGFDGVHALFENPADFRLVLTHQPQIFDRIKNYGQMLILTGHTHGGQIRLPFFPTIYAPEQGFFPSYGNGFFHHESATMYVSRGIGTTYFRLRFWNRPIVTIHELNGGIR